MNVEYLYQNVKDKLSFLKGFSADHGYRKEEIGYIGDDLNDLPSMRLTGFVGCPADSCREVIEIADYVSNVKGGHGAVRDVIEHILRETGEWEKAVSKIFETGI